MRIYPYRTTYDKLDDGTAQRHIEESGDTMVSSHFLGGRDWVLICRNGEPTVADLTAAQLQTVICDGMRDAFRLGDQALAAGLRVGH